jgi:hypothetical protein
LMNGKVLSDVFWFVNRGLIILQKKSCITENYIVIGGTACDFVLAEAVNG